MKRLCSHIPDQLIVKGRQVLAFFLLLTLCLPSSCALKQGIIFFFSTSVSEKSASVKAVKAIALPKVKLESGISDCKMKTCVKASVQLTSRAQASTANLLPFLFLILPGFLISLLVTDKKLSRIPIPYSRIRSPKTAIFLQNRLLLI
ncbi:hypothetical protein [Pedobacter caeni]|uniref:Uncharacterized protein n=1 Tax=Pedobacter caeni TaxID=288992 RepID=A0A1M4X334_9SPHI|nr:hypothetical protein [Pedobacter caeni]SHE87622.1 hypothetical protein SAMN04488522_1011470 [Pedobacter caeni]